MTPGSGGDTAWPSTSGHTPRPLTKHIILHSLHTSTAYCILHTAYCGHPLTHHGATEQPRYTEEVIAETVGLMGVLCGLQEDRGRRLGVPADCCWVTCGWSLLAGSLCCSLKLPGCQRSHYCQHGAMVVRPPPQRGCWWPGPSTATTSLHHPAAASTTASHS